MGSPWRSNAVLRQQADSRIVAPYWRFAMVSACPCARAFACWQQPALSWKIGRAFRETSRRGLCGSTPFCHSRHSRPGSAPDRRPLPCPERARVLEHDKPPVWPSRRPRLGTSRSGGTCTRCSNTASRNPGELLTRFDFSLTSEAIYATWAFSGIVSGAPANPDRHELRPAALPGMIPPLRTPSIRRATGAGRSAADAVHEARGRGEGCDPGGEARSRPPLATRSMDATGGPCGSLCWALGRVSARAIRPACAAWPG